MHYNKIGFVVLADDVAGASGFYEQHLGFTPVARLGWYASHQHPDLPGVFLDILRTGHPSAGRLGAGPTNGVLIGLESDDCRAEWRRLRQAGVPIESEPADEPWGQRRFQFDAPGGVVIEIVESIAPDPEWMAANMAG